MEGNKQTNNLYITKINKWITGARAVQTLHENGPLIG